MVAALVEEGQTTAPQRSLSAFRCQMLAKDVALVTYTASRQQADGQEVRTLRSSIWRQEGAGWRLCFHQGTRAAG